MSSFSNKFTTLNEINDKKKTIVISEGGKPQKKKEQKPKVEKTAAPKAAVAKTAAPAKAAAKPAKAGAKASDKPVGPYKPVNSLTAHKQALKRELEAKKDAPVVEAPVVEEVAVVEEPV
eukprot:125875_1